MYFLTKVEKDLLSLFNSHSSLTKCQIIEEICKNEKSSLAIPQVENAIDGCVAKGFVALTNDGFLKSQKKEKADLAFC